jgi:leader peptidase (prepilin peptidase) / N-methyltransferase
VLEATLALLFGLLIGSFLNVCIYRLPRDLSVVRPRSRCVACQRPIAWYDNVPVLSYLLLRGRCRYCQARISPRYPMVELLTGALFFVYILRMGVTPAAIKYCLLGAMLVALGFTDLEQRILPDEFTVGGTVVGLVLSWFIEVRDVMAHVLFLMFGIAPGRRVLSCSEALLGGLFPALLLWLGGYIYEKVRRREGMGFGDVKMILMVGSFLGLQGSLLTLIFGSVAGSVIGIAYVKLTRRDMASYELPFGTFLAFGGIAVTLVGPRFFEWYGGLF